MVKKAAFLDGIYPVPDLPPGKLVFNKNSSGVVYIQLVLEHGYNPSTKFSTSKRISIGRLVDPADRTRMYANVEYAKRFPCLTPIAESELENPKRNAVVSIGGFIALEHIYKEQGVYPILDDAISGDEGLLLDMSFAYILNENNACQHIEPYSQNHPLNSPSMRPFSDSTISRVLLRHEQEEFLAFIEKWNAKQDHSQTIYISFDSTNKNCAAGDIDIVNFGHPKVDVGSPVYNVSLAFNQTNQVPLSYKLYNGSLNDVKQLKSCVDELSALGYHNIGMILDRGYFSRENIKYMDDSGFHFLIMAKGCKTLVRGIVDEFHGTFEFDSRCHVEGTDIFATSIERKLYEDDTEPRYFHICFSQTKAAAELNDLMKRIADLDADIKKHEGQEYTPSEECKEYFTLQYEANGALMFGMKNHDAITAAFKRCGYFCLISSTKMDACTAYTLYSGRDSTEKLFRADKTFLGARSARVHKEKSLRTKAFTEFLALIGRNRLFNLLRAEMKRLNVKRNDMTVPSAIRQLEQIILVRFPGMGCYRLANSLSKAQKEILRAIGMSEDDFIARANQLAEELNDSWNQVNLGVNKDAKAS